MKKNRMMRIASVLLVAVLLSTCVISGTFAKYTTSATASDAARVAKWGFNTATINFEDLFAASYTNVANGSDEKAIIAPGTSGKTSFQFVCTASAPEVAYTFKVDTSGSENDTTDNANIRWRLTTSDATPTDWNGTTDTWDKLIADIKALSGDASGTKEYAAGAELPAIVSTKYYIHWDWAFNNSNDSADNTLGQDAVSADKEISLSITISATQVD